MNLESYLEVGSVIVGPWKSSNLGEHETCEVVTLDEGGNIQSLTVTSYPTYSEEERTSEIVWAIRELQNWNR